MSQLSNDNKYILDDILDVAERKDSLGNLLLKGVVNTVRLLLRYIVL